MRGLRRLRRSGPGRRPAPSTDHSGRYLPARRQRSGAVPANPGLRAEMRGHLHQQLLGIPVRPAGRQTGGLRLPAKAHRGGRALRLRAALRGKNPQHKGPRRPELRPDRGGEDSDRRPDQRTPGRSDLPPPGPPGGRAGGQPTVPAGIRNRRSSGCGVVSRCRPASWHWRSGRF